MVVTLPDCFAITASRRRELAIVELHGELDIAAQTQLRAGLRRGLASGSRLVLVDLRDLSFIEASGLQALVNLRTTCEEHDRRLVLIRGADSIQELFVRCELEPGFQFVEDPRDARERARPAFDPPVDAEPPVHRRDLRRSGMREKALASRGACRSSSRR